MKKNTRLRVLRAERGISQLDLATNAHISSGRYWRIENGYSKPSSAERVALARAFGVAETDVFPVDLDEREGARP